jgi:MFS family permease
MQVLGGALAFGAGFVVRQIIASRALPYPSNFALLFFIGAALLLLSLLSFSRVREPAGTVTLTKREPLGAYFRRVPSLFRRNPAAARLVVTRMLASGLSLAVPFFAIYGRDKLGFPPEAAGIFVSAQMLGTVVGSLVWARIGDFHGNRLLVRSTVAAGAATPLVALLLSPLAGTGIARLLYPIAFAVLGAAFSGTWIGFTNYLIEITAEAERPYYLGAANTLVAPFTSFGVLGGLVVAKAGYMACFALSATLCLCALAVSAGLPEPRRADATQIT